MAMTDEGLRVKAAELIGWKAIETVLLCRDLYSTERSEETLLGIPPEWKDTTHEVPDYPTDIAAAWGLLSVIPNVRWGLHELDAGGWTAFAMKRSDPGWVNCGEGEGDVAPLAITRAFIMAMEDDDAKEA
jgi:hypothetical protein